MEGRGEGWRGGRGERSERDEEGGERQKGRGEEVRGHITLNPINISMLQFLINAHHTKIQLKGYIKAQHKLPRRIPPPPPKKKNKQKTNNN